MPQNNPHYLPVNWMDGMKINKSHFIAQNNAFTLQAAQGVSSLLNNFNYGLLPDKNNGNGVKIFVSADNQQQVQVRLQRCTAVTLGGYVIEFDENDFSINTFKAFIPQLSVPFAELKGKSAEYLVVVVVNPYKRVPYGDGDPNETPPRLPYTLPSYELQLMPVNETKENALGNFQIPVARVRVEDQKVLLDEDYIPPCSSINSHTDLVEIHAALENFFGKIELYSLQIIQRILQKKQQNEMAFITQRLCEQIIFFTALQLNEFKQINLYQPPVFLINTVSAFARVIKNTLDVYIGSGKEELINYCIEWCDVNQGELEGAITTLANHKYDHLDINNSIEKVSVFTKLISRLFVNLSKLEYIGKRKEAGIFVKEQIIKPEPEPQPKKRRSFLAE